MKIFISSLGSRGDVQPYLALAVGLKARGHEVLFSAPCRFQSFVEEHGIDYAYMNDEFLKIIDSDIGKEILENKRGIWTGIKATAILYRSMKPLILSMIDDNMRAARAFQPDLIIAGSKGIMVEPVADILNCPLAYAMPVVQMVPTYEIPAIGFPDLGIRCYNRFSYAVANFFMGLYTGWLNKYRREEGMLPAKPRRYKPYQRLDGTMVPMLHCFSETLCPRPSDWPDFAQVSGFWFLESLDPFEPPEDLVTFLGAGEPPIYVGFGSMSGRKPERTTRIILEAASEVNARFILASGWGGLSEKQTFPESIHLLKEAPHDWLFPRVKAVVHHGGAGTTAAGLRAGKPTLICPFFADQPFWGKRVHALGAGPQPIPQKKLSVETLVPALKELMNNEAMKLKAEALAVQLAEEDGIQDSIDYLEAWMASKTSHPPDKLD